MLKRLNPVAMFVILGPVSASLLAAGGSEPQVRMVITEQKFCLGQPGGFGVIEKQSPDAITFRLRVELLYRNTGSENLILPLLEDATAILSRSLAEVKNHKNQHAIRFRSKREPWDLGAAGVELDRPKLPLFDVIPPGEENKMHPSEHVILRVHGTSATQTKLLGSRLFLQLELDHLQFPRRLAQDLAVRWRDYGQLWTGKVRTEPIEFNIPPLPKFGDCSNEYRID